MKVLLTVLTSLIGLLCTLMGFRWLISPEAVAPAFGITLPNNGLGLSSLIGGFSGFFLTGAACIVVALISKQRTWYYPVVFMMLATAFGRGASSIFHDASFESARIVAELAMGIILLAAANALAD